VPLNLGPRYLVAPVSRGGRCATPLDRRHLNVRALHHKGSGRPLLYDSHLVLRTTRRYAVTASKSGDKEQGCCPPVFKRTKIRGAGPPVDKARSAAIATVPNGTSYVWPSDSLGLRDVLARSDSASGDLRPQRSGTLTVWSVDGDTLADASALTSCTSVFFPYSLSKHRSIPRKASGPLL